jgi:uncharacterized protein (TIGR02217 family)
MADFLEERFCGQILLGASWQDDYAVTVVQTSGGQEYRSLAHPFPLRKFDVSYLLDRADTAEQLLAVWHRAHGQYAGFRARCFDDWSSNGATGAPTAFDQPMAPVSAGVYQLRKYYGTDKSAGAAGHPYRTIHKPVAGTVLVGIGATAIRAADWSVVASTGRVTLAAGITRPITAITQAAQAQITVGSGHGLVAGQSVHVSGVAGMTQINGLRALIVAADGTTITAAINSAGFAAYASGGSVNTGPQSGESVTAGFQFDFMVRFGSALVVGQDYPNHRSTEGVILQELIAP